MPRRSTIVPHPLTKVTIDNLPQARHEDGLTLRTAHVDSPQSTRNPAVSPKNSDISVADGSRISKHSPSDPDSQRLVVDTSSSFEEEWIDMKRSPGEEDDENEQDDHYYTPPKQDNDHLLVFKDAPSRKRRGL